MGAESNPQMQLAEDKILSLLGERKAALWSNLRTCLADNYPGCIAVFSVEGKDKSYVFRYRKSGKTLVTLYPADRKLTVLIVLGKKEVAKLENCQNVLNSKIRQQFLNARQLHDGRWLWVEPSSKADIESIKVLLNVKRRPKPRQTL